MIFLVWILFGIASAVVGTQKGRSGCGWFAIGMLLGPFGLLFSLLVSSEKEEPTKVIVVGTPEGSPTLADPRLDIRTQITKLERPCSECAEVIKAEAKVCRFCGNRFTAEEVAGRVGEAQAALLAKYPDAPIWRGRLCPECGTQNGADRNVCRHCARDIRMVPITLDY